MHRIRPMHLKSRRPRPRRKRKDMQVSKRQPLNELVSLPKKSLALAGKANHHIGANRRIRQRRANLLHLRRIVPGTIPPMHQPQHRIRTRLQRKMRMARQPRMLPTPKLPKQPNQLRRPIHRLNRTDPQPRQRRPLQNRRDQILKPRHGRKITTPSPQIDARKHQLLPTRLSKLTSSPQTLIQRNRTARPPSHRNNAERTPVSTTILDLQVRPSLMSIRRKRQRRNFGMGKERVMPDRRARAPQCRRSLPQKRINRYQLVRGPLRVRSQPQRSIDHKRLMAVPNDYIDAIQRRNFLWRTLRIAASEDDPRPRIRPPHPPQKGACAAVRLSRHAARIENHHRSGSQVASLGQSRRAQAGGNRLAIRPARPAAEVLNVIFFHVNQSINGIDAR